MVLKEVGASWRRDAVDQRLIQEVSTGKSKSGREKNGIISSQRDVGGWPILEIGEILKDSDQDGMPVEWEMGKDLNPFEHSDASGFTLDSIYSNIEVYLNSLVRD